MSVSATIDVRLRRNGLLALDRTLEALRASGWAFDDGYGAFFLPLGDQGDFNWTRASLPEVELIALLRRKLELGEIVGVAMTWQGTCVGGELLFWDTGLMSISLSINRKIDVKSGVTDVNWYLERIIPALRSAVGVESIDFRQHE